MTRYVMRARMTTGQRPAPTDEQRNKFVATIEESYNRYFGLPNVEWENDRQALVLLRVEAPDRQLAENSVKDSIRRKAEKAAAIDVQDVEIVEVTVGDE